MSVTQDYKTITLDPLECSLLINALRSHIKTAQGYLDLDESGYWAGEIRKARAMIARLGAE